MSTPEPTTKDVGGRPRKRASEPRIDARYAEAHRLEDERDEAAAVWEREATVAAKVVMCAAEQRVASAWASALRSDNKVGEALSCSNIAAKWAYAHKQALDQLVADRVEELHRRIVRRDAATKAAAGGED